MLIWIRRCLLRAFELITINSIWKVEANGKKWINFVWNCASNSIIIIYYFVLLLFQRSFVQFIWLQLDANVFCIQPSARQQIIFKTKNEKKKKMVMIFDAIVYLIAHIIFSRQYFLFQTLRSLSFHCTGVFLRWFVKMSRLCLPRAESYGVKQ